MPKAGKLIISILLPCLLSACATVSIEHGTSPNVLHPQSPAAENIVELWWILFGLSSAVFVLITGLLLYIVFVRNPRKNQLSQDERRATGQNWILYGGIVMPSVVLFVTFGFTLRSLALMPDPAETAEMQINVIGHRWWWEVRYPDLNVITANEIHIPVNTPVEIVLTSDDVIHSFWVPELYGKMDLIPGRTNSLQLQANAEGVYRGECAEFCGIQHAHMQFLVIAESQTDFDAWIEAQAQPAIEPQSDLLQRGQTVFIETGCIRCHTIRGVHESRLALGPDLTHLASRRTIAGASRENNLGNLGGWIIDPQHIKPGNLMPVFYFSSEDHQALLAYLASLR